MFHDALHQPLAQALSAQLQALEASARFRALVEQSVAVTLHAADGALLYDSPAVSQLLGHRPVGDLAAIKLARDTARRIEEEMEYPGQIKVTVIRESRAVDFAK